MVVHEEKFDKLNILIDIDLTSFRGRKKIACFSRLQKLSKQYVMEVIKMINFSVYRSKYNFGLESIKKFPLNKSG